MKLPDLLNVFYEQMETAEGDLRKKIMRAFDAVMGEALASVFVYLSAGAPTARITKSRAGNLRAKTTETAGQLFSFDEIRRLNNAEALELELAILAEKQAEKAFDLLRESLRDEIEALWDMLNEYMDAGVPLDMAVVEAIVNDPDFPIRQTLITNHVKAARATTRKILQAQARGLDSLDIINLATDSLKKTIKAAFDATMYYEDTRAVTETVFAVYELLDEMHDTESYFRTVCVRDGKACETCIDIEAAQAVRPVRITDRMTGVNCPPFHPFCRCRIDIVEGAHGKD